MPTTANLSCFPVNFLSSCLLTLINVSLLLHPQQCIHPRFLPAFEKKMLHEPALLLQYFRDSSTTVHQQQSVKSFSLQAFGVNIVYMHICVRVMYHSGFNHLLRHGVCIGFAQKLLVIIHSHRITAFIENQDKVGHFPKRLYTQLEYLFPILKMSKAACNAITTCRCWYA